MAAITRPVSATIEPAPSALLEARSAVPLTGERIYLAARTARRDEMRSIAGELELAGAVVICSWIDLDPDQEIDPRLHLNASAEVAAADLDDLFSATACIAFTETDTALQKGRGGRHVEFGAALALGLRMIVVGPAEHVFHCLPAVECYGSWSEARCSLLTPRGDAAALA